MLVNPGDKNDLTIRFRRAPQGILARVFDWIGAGCLAISVLALVVYGMSSSLETEGTSLRTCLTCLNIAIIAFVAARLVELGDRVLRMSVGDGQ